MTSLMGLLDFNVLSWPYKSSLPQADHIEKGHCASGVGGFSARDNILGRVRNPYVRNAPLVVNLYKACLRRLVLLFVAQLPNADHI